MSQTIKEYRVNTMLSIQLDINDTNLKEAEKIAQDRIRDLLEYTKRWDKKNKVGSNFDYKIYYSHDFNHKVK